MYNNLASTYKIINEYDLAFEAFNNSILLNPKNINILQ